MKQSTEFSLSPHSILGHREKIPKIPYELVLLGTVILLAIIITIGSKGNFLAFSNITGVLVDVAIIAIPAVGMTLVIVTGGIDVSIGSVLGFTATAAGLTFSHNWTIGPTVLVIMALGAFAGVVNAVLIAYGRIPSIIATLGMMSVWRAAVFAALQGNWISDIPPSLTQLFIVDKVLIFPWAFILAIVLVAVTQYAVNHRPLGRQIYAVGNNEEAATITGIPTRRVQLFTYTFLGVLTAIASLMTLAQSPLVQATTGSGFELQVIAAVVLGGTDIMGGRGTIVGSLLGAMLVELIHDGVILFHIQPFWTGVITGFMIILAIYASLVSRRGVNA